MTESNKKTGAEADALLSEDSRRLPSGSWIKYDDFAAGLLDAAPDAVFVVDTEGTILVANRRCETLLGYKRDDLLGKSVEILLPEDKRSGHQERLQHYFKHPSVRDMARDLDLHARHQDGTLIPVGIALSPADFGEDRLVIASMRDARERRAMEEKLRFAGTHDPLTGLYNRAFFEEEAARLNYGRSPIGVVVVDIDGLKPINDELGHAAGDAILRRLSEVLRAAFRKGDIVARVGGDEFYALLPDLGIEQTEAMAARIQAEIAKDNESAAGPTLRCSVGTALCENPGHLQDALRAADRQMYARKRRKRGAAMRAPSEPCLVAQEIERKSKAPDA